MNSPRSNTETFHHPNCEICLQIEPVVDLRRVAPPQHIPIIPAPFPNPNDMASFVSVTVLSKESDRAFLLMGPPCCCTAAVNGDTLLIVQFDLLTLISLPEGQILQQKVIDCPGGCLGIYPLGEDWLIHAEDAIIRLDRKLQLLWHRCGSDIFVSVDGGDSVTLTEDRILLRDFQDNHYELDFQGNLIEFIEKASV